MEDINNMAKNRLEELARNNLTKEGKKDLTIDIVTGCIGITLLCAGFIFSKLFPDKSSIRDILYTIGFVVEALPIYIEAFGGLITKQLTHSVEILVAIAITAAFFSGQLALGLLVPLILNLSHILEERSIMGGREAIDSLKRMQQTSAIRLDGDTETKVEANSLEPGQTVIVRPGMFIPIDGEILTGTTAIDQKSLTGEPEPFEAGVGDKVYAGTMNISGTVTVKVLKKHSDTSFANVLKYLENAENMEIPESRIIDRFLCYYIPFVLAVAAAVALINSDLTKAIAVLVVSCPCGQMLVSSAPMIAAISAATKHGILIKNAKFIEKMTGIDAVVFDKTGTLTAGEMSLTGIFCAEGTDETRLLELAYTVANGSAHPISRAVTAYALPRGITAGEAREIHEVPGKGLSAVTDEGKTVYFGRIEWIEELGVKIPEDFQCSSTGSVSYITEDGIFYGALGFDDTVRPDAPLCISKLKALGVSETVMLTGDRQAAAERIRNETGVDIAHAQLLPEDKLQRLRELRAEDRTVVAVGDGINDAPALKEASVGIAMGAMGADLAIDSADIALMNNNLNNIPFTITLARKTKRIIYENLVITMAVSFTMMALSAFGVISAVAGAVLHNIGAFAVLINSSRLIRLNTEENNITSDSEKGASETDAE